MERVGTLIDGVGVLIVVIGALWSAARYVTRLGGAPTPLDHYQEFRRNLGRAILLGLEFLVAGDIIRTVAVSPTFGSVGVLAIIVLIRTFLSATLTVEIEGRWPWQARPDRPTTPA